MAALDWIILIGTLAFIVIYGTWKTKGSKNIEGYFKGNNEMKWYTIGLSIMATQASAITFLSTPGQAFEDGMRFIQFYFGLPIAMVIISITIIPIYYRLKVYTAYEYLENRFDYKTRLLAAFLFLVQRGLAAGITIYAPAIILSSILGWNLNLTNIFIGLLVIIYTVAGGADAVSKTQMQQMLVILVGMTVAYIIIVYSLPETVSFSNAVSIAGVMGKMNIVDFSLDFTTRYTFWSGITGGLFLAMSYFGTDQSQVQRYLSGKSLKESRLGLMFNGLLKIPMQFLILFTGVMVFVFYQFEQSPLFFNEHLKQQVYETSYKDEMNAVERAHTANFEYKRDQINQYVSSLNNGDNATAAKAAQNIKIAGKQENELRAEGRTIIRKAFPEREVRDTDYIFISFIMKYLPTGVIGLLLAVIFCAAMSSTSGELNSLASTTVIDFYKRRINTNGSEKHYVVASRWFTVFWGAMAILFATFASLVDNLIQAVNILGSIFYGTILGIFLVAFYIKKINSQAVFIGALISQIAVILLYLFSDIGFLWFNVIGCGMVIGLGLALSLFKLKNF